MFIRNDKTCSYCGKCNTFDLFTSSGVVRFQGNIDIGMTLQCVNCADTFLLAVDPLIVYEIFVATVVELPKSANWSKLYAKMSPYSELFSISNSELEGFVRVAFPRNICDPDVAQTFWLSDFVSKVLVEVGAGEEDYLPFVQISRLKYSVTTRSQPLAS